MSEFKAAVQILNATVGVVSNREGLLPSFPPDIKVESLLTDFRQVENIPYEKGLDGYISVQDQDIDPLYKVEDDTVIFRGPFSRLEKRTSDARYTLWGNQGFLYRYALYLLEKRHGIFNLHACALHDEEGDILYVIIGGAGTGKTVYLLSGLEKGLKLFSTETVHFQIKANQIIWHMGSLADNIRFGTLIHDFPEFLAGIKIPSPREIWQKKIALDLSEFRTSKEILKCPQAVYILFPHIERGFEKTIWNPVKDKKKTAKILFDNISQKLAETVLLYDHLTVVGWDEVKLAQRRLEAIRQLLDHDSISQTASVLSNPKDCWNQLL
jgi:hypothetical protein